MLRQGPSLLLERVRMTLALASELASSRAARPPSWRPSDLASPSNSPAWMRSFRTYRRLRGRGLRRAPRKGRMSVRLLCLTRAALVAGCATRLPSTSFADPAALERATNGYYEHHAVEEHGYCDTPYIDGLSQVAVVTNSRTDWSWTSATCTATGFRMVMGMVAAHASATPAAASPWPRAPRRASPSLT
jgi:hypothetical protein